jgi:hypothetical protein
MRWRVSNAVSLAWALLPLRSAVSESATLALTVVVVVAGKGSPSLSISATYFAMTASYSRVPARSNAIRSGELVEKHIRADALQLRSHLLQGAGRERDG